MRRTVMFLGTVLYAMGCGSSDNPDTNSATMLLTTGGAVSNPSFESGLTGWAAYQSSLSQLAVTGAPDGQYVARVTWTTGSTFSIHDSPASITSTVAGTAYTGSAYVRAASAASVGAPITLYVTERTSGGSSVKEVASTPLTLTSSFQKVSMTITASASGDVIGLRASQGKATTGAAFDIDLATLVQGTASTTTADAGTTTDAGTSTDAGTTTDAGTSTDGGTTSTYTRPFGPNAPWNRPVKGLPLDPNSATLASMLWNDAPISPGVFGLQFDQYTYPVYYVANATGTYPVKLTNTYGNMNGKTIPWSSAFLPATGTDAQVILLDPATGSEWDFWQVSFDGTTVSATNGNLVPGSYWTKEDGFTRSRGCGIEYLAMLVRPEEIQAGVIQHALSMPIRDTSGQYYVAPATKLEHPNNPPGIPEGTRFFLDVTDADIDAWIAALPSALPAATRSSARIIANALRDYGWFITDTGGTAILQFEWRGEAGAKWDALGLNVISAGKTYPRHLIDGLMQPDRIRVVVPSDQYPAP